MSYFFFFNDTATTEIYTLSLHDALPISRTGAVVPVARAPHGLRRVRGQCRRGGRASRRSEEHTSELQSQSNIVCRLLLEKKKTKEVGANICYSEHLPLVADNSIDTVLMC